MNYPDDNYLDKHRVRPQGDSQTYKAPHNRRAELYNEGPDRPQSYHSPAEDPEAGPVRSSRPGTISEKGHMPHPGLEDSSSSLEWLASRLRRSIREQRVQGSSMISGLTSHSHCR